MNIADSITATNTKGSDTERNTKSIIISIAIIETELTILKSVSVIVIRSFVQGASG